MADFNPFHKAIQKHAGRAKERLLQNLGKADKTTDEDFDLHVKNFSKQQSAATRIQKEFKNYYSRLREMQDARRSLMDTVCELYEPCWDGVDKFLIKSEVLNKNFDDFCNKLNEELLAPVGCYVNQFPEISNKIAKRKRKLLDYDNSRHNLQNVEATIKKREETKIAKAKENLEQAQSQFELINNELHEELPALYDSRVSFFASNLQFMFVTEANFHQQDGELFVGMSDILRLLNEAHKKGSLSQTPKLDYESKGSPKQGRLSLKEVKSDKVPSGDESSADLATTANDCNEKTVSDITAAVTDRLETNVDVSEYKTPPTEFEPDKEEPETIPNVQQEDLKQGFKTPPPEFEPEDEPEKNPNVLYQVKGTYKYSAEDVDELSFDVGDVIDVIPYEDPEEQEEGWLMGVFNGKKGLFPANFTSRL